LEKLKDVENLEYVFGQHRIEDFINTSMVIKNPSVPWNNKHIKLAMEKKVPVEMDASLFFQLCKNPIVGITGTKGKTTTAALIFEILKEAGKNPVRAGSGQIAVLDKLKDLEEDSTVVFELSSWRLSALGRIKKSPRVAVLTNIFPDHLNYYKTMEEYIADKKYIFSYQKPDDFCIINWDNDYLKKIEPEIKSQVIKFSEGRIAQGKAVYLNEGIIYLNDGVDEKEVIKTSEIKLRGKHNISNILAAIGAGYAMGVNIEQIKKGIQNFHGILHRLEFVREVDGTKYYNDTSATTPESAIAGINSFSEPIILIAGGSDKNLNMTELAKTIAEKVKSAVFLKGAGTDKIIEAMKNYLGEEGKDKNFRIVDSMEKAVELARAEVHSGDVVLFSPGAASFGLFANEFDRGDKFRVAVKKLK
ncbi:UDP-N-acetylmuramoyl-L-alanine--D-glutamate ligase, partial [Patescibacteria group bacterium]|nr:UDP-N-acetylmuramoyl-L-alanine--D-glutamate ligase [Patescibacteria group bacterium]